MGGLGWGPYITELIPILLAFGGSKGAQIASVLGTGIPKALDTQNALTPAFRDIEEHASNGTQLELVIHQGYIDLRKLASVRLDHTYKQYCGRMAFEDKY